MTEKYVQTNVIQLLKTLDWVVFNVTPMPGIPSGEPDVTAFRGRTYIKLEFKKSKTAPFRPLQNETLAMYKSWGVYSKVVYPENMEEVKSDIRRMSR